MQEDDTQHTVEHRQAQVCIVWESINEDSVGNVKFCLKLIIKKSQYIKSFDIYFFLKMAQ